MKKGLAVIILVSLALVASSCGMSNLPPYIDWDAEVSSGVGGKLNSSIGGGSIPSFNFRTTILTTPTVEELLDALREVEEVDSDTKETIDAVLDVLPVLGDWLAEIPDETWQAIDVIMGNTTEFDTVVATTAFLQDEIDSGEYDDYEYLPEALGFGIELLEAGAADLFSPTWSPYLGHPFHTYGFNVTQMMRAALEGGITGAVGAALAGYAPAQYVINVGGCLGSLNSLVADVISQLAGYW